MSPDYFVQVLKHLAPEVSYRSLVTLGIASVQGTPVASFEKEDADRLLFFCTNRVGNDSTREENVISCLPRWSSALVKERSMYGLETKPIMFGYAFSEHGMACKFSNQDAKNTRLNVTTMRPIPHSRKRKLLPYFGAPSADANGGSQVQNTHSHIPSVKHNPLPPAPAVHKKSSNSLRAQQIIPLNPLPLKKHGCDRPPIQACSEVCSLSPLL